MTSTSFLAKVSNRCKFGVDINPLTRNGLVDGFEARERDGARAGQVLSTWRDHRIFMSLLVASLGIENPNFIDGHRDMALAVRLSHSRVSGRSAVGGKRDVWDEIAVD